jgi:hypothetical protein
VFNSHPNEQGPLLVGRPLRGPWPGAAELGSQKPPGGELRILQKSMLISKQAKKNSLNKKTPKMRT